MKESNLKGKKNTTKQFIISTLPLRNSLTYLTGSSGRKMEKFCTNLKIKKRKKIDEWKVDFLSTIMLQYYSQLIKQRLYRALCYIPRLELCSRVTKETEDANPALKEILQAGKQAKASLGLTL